MYERICKTLSRDRIFASLLRWVWRTNLSMFSNRNSPSSLRTSVSIKCFLILAVSSLQSGSLERDEAVFYKPAPE